MTRVVTLTGGLDSTWVMHKLLTLPDDMPAELIRPVYLDFNQGIRAAWLEYMLSSESALRMLMKTEMYQRTLDWRSPPHNVFNHIRGNNTARLVQQGNVITSLAFVMNEEQCRDNEPVTAYVGWNKGDCIERNYTRGEWSEADYERLRVMYESLIYFQDHAPRPHPLMTPAWDKTKMEMWMELPHDIRELVTVASHYSIEFIPCPEIDMLYVEINLENSAKHIRYSKMGIELSVAWRFSLTEAFWKRIQKTTCPLNGIGPSLPSELLKIPEEYKVKEGWAGPLSLDSKSDTLAIRAYSREEWADYRPKLKSYLRERDDRERERQKLEAASGNLDSADGKVAQSVGVSTTGPAN
ncbi:hypothetical protein pEaSNUABM8_00145 [Erwinia phage pEa_SNUABM_8]|nr:hypothetical protein pEaSNUABM8_00145 [Erwinia phage pEa_SNUABM_8]QVW54897.1 hypothetical protein pEaSNUABM4_00144 [Erwinia phage pEa_SNUABM_4]